MGERGESGSSAKLREREDLECHKIQDVRSKLEAGRQSDINLQVYQAVYKPYITYVVCRGGNVIWGGVMIV